jgi:hypothetical protein
MRIISAFGAKGIPLAYIQYMKVVPMTNLAFLPCKITYSKVRAMSRVATPENEHLFVDRASTLFSHDLFDPLQRGIVPV